MERVFLVLFSSTGDESINQFAFLALSLVAWSQTLQLRT